MVDFSIVRKGFDTTEVDTYIVSMEAELEKKEKLLNEYRAKEGAINQAVIEAQLIADSIVAKAKEEAQALKSDAAKELVGIREEALKMRKTLADFQDGYNRLLSRYIFQAHCDDMKQLYDRMEDLMNKLELDPQDKMPSLMDEPQETPELKVAAIDPREPDFEAGRIHKALI